MVPELIGRFNNNLCNVLYFFLMKVLIFGAGGVGSVMGGFLARMGHDVSLVGRAWHLDVIKKEGLLITGIWGDTRSKAFRFYTSAEEIKSQHEHFDLIILTVKSFDTAQAVMEIETLMDENTTLLSLQNGLGNIETILSKIKSENLLIGRVIFGVELTPGVAKVTVTADPIAIGALPGVKTKLSAETVAHIFNLSKIETRAVSNILTVIWAKVIYNCALNGICSVHEIPYGKILEREETKNDMKEIVRECYRVGQKKGIALDPPDAEAYIDLLMGTLIPRTASHTPSMLQDIKRGKRIDLEALNGAICRLGKELGIATPVNQKVVDKVLKKIQLTPY